MTTRPCRKYTADLSHLCVMSIASQEQDELADSTAGVGFRDDSTPANCSRPGSNKCQVAAGPGGRSANPSHGPRVEASKKGRPDRQVRGRVDERRICRHSSSRPSQAYSCAEAPLRSRPYGAVCLPLRPDQYALRPSATLGSAAERSNSDNFCPVPIAVDTVSDCLVRYITFTEVTGDAGGSRA
jgi:hypothetical protein